MRRPPRVVRSVMIPATAALVLGVGAWPTQAQDKPAAEAAKPKTVMVEAGPLKVQAELKGVFEAQKAAEISVHPEAWAQPLTVRKAVPHGSTVQQGDVLVEFDTEKLDRAIAALKVEQELAALALELAAQELPILERLLPLDLAAAERAKRHADEDLKQFLDVDRPLQEEGVRFGLKSALEMLKYSREELKQLQAMYRDKDLTEETEEMILQRQRFEVESGEFRLKQQTISSEQTLNVAIPRKEQAVREAAAKETLDLEKAKATLPLSLNQKRLALRKSRYDFEQATVRFNELSADREALKVVAPTDGVVYYGKSTDGQWSPASATAAKLTPGGAVPPGEVLMTVVQPKPLFVRATVEEKDLYKLSTGLKGRIAPAGYPSARLAGRLEAVAAVPKAPGSFDARVAVELAEGSPAIVPGMACTVKLSDTVKPDALTVPASAVFSDDDEVTRYVYRAGADGKAEKQAVQVGLTVGDRIEITGGLKAGDTIRAEKP